MELHFIEMWMINQKFPENFGDCWSDRLHVSVILGDVLLKLVEIRVIVPGVF